MAAARGLGTVEYDKLTLKVSQLGSADVVPVS